MVDAAALRADLTDEGNALDAFVAGLPDDAWTTPTPAPGWTIADQIGHLAWTDGVAIRAATDPDAFADLRASAAADPIGYVDSAAHALAERPVAELLASWRTGRRRLVEALAAVPAGTKLPWFGPPMSAASMATSRLMELWAHGVDIADTFGAAPSRSARLQHVAYLGVRTRDFAYAVRGRTPPREPFRIELAGPAGELWAWGPPEAVQQVAGPALDFCLLVTQRRHRADLAVVATGEQADEWLDIAQAFAGPPGAGRTPGAAPLEPGPGS